MASGLDIYEKHIRDLSDEQKRMIAVLLDEDIEHKERSISELRGLGRKIWEDTSADAYVDGLRDEWDSES